MGNRWGNSGNSDWLYFWSSKITADGDCSHKIKRHLLLGRKIMTNLDSIFKSRDMTLPTKVCSKGYSFQWSCIDVRVGLWRKLSAEELMLLNCGVGEDSWESLGLQGDPTSPFWRRSVLGVLCKDWCWRSNFKLCSPDAKSWLIWKDPDAGKVWGQEEKGTTEDEMAGWHHQLDRHGFGWTLGVGDGQGGLACCSSRVQKESNMTEWLNWLNCRLEILVNSL